MRRQVQQPALSVLRRGRHVVNEHQLLPPFNVPLSPCGGVDAEDEFNDGLVALVPFLCQLLSVDGGHRHQRYPKHAIPRRSRLYHAMAITAQVTISASASSNRSLILVPPISPAPR